MNEMIIEGAYKKMSDQQNNAFHHAPEPYWRESVELPAFSPLTDNIDVDVAIVGGGIAGLTAAYILSKSGKKVAVIEANKLLNGTTGHTTAKVTAQHGLFYDELIQHFGEEFARKYYKANSEAIQFVRDTVKNEQVECDLTTEDAHVYSQTEKYDKKVRKEYEAYQTLGIEGDLINTLPVNIPIKSAVVMKNQAQFHPLKYFKKLIDSITQNGGQIFEGTVAKDIKENTSTSVVTKDGYHVHSQKVLVCTHFPFYDGMGFYFTRMYAERSYILGVKTKKEYPGGLYINAENPTRSLRYTTTKDGEKLVLVSGDNHKTGQGEDTLEHYRALEEFTEEVLGIDEIPYRWSAQDLYTLDKVPYIGQLNKNHPSVFVATGFKKWGMTSGTLSGQLLSDLVLGNHNLYKDVFDPSRFVADPSLKKFFKHNLDVAGHFIKGKLENPTRHLDDIQNGEAGITIVNGQRAGAFRDENGTLHLVDTTCTHLGCEVEWNHGDHTWDCPCHGSRFNITGDVIEGPAKKPLKKVE